MTSQVITFGSTEELLPEPSDGGRDQKLPTHGPGAGRWFMGSGTLPVGQLSTSVLAGLQALGRVLLRPSWSQSLEPPNQLSEVGGWECWGAGIWDSFQHLWRRDLWTWEGTDSEWGGTSFEGWALW